MDYLKIEPIYESVHFDFLGYGVRDYIYIHTHKTLVILRISSTNVQKYKCT